MIKVVFNKSPIGQTSSDRRSLPAYYYATRLC